MNLKIAVIIASVMLISSLSANIYFNLQIHLVQDNGRQQQVDDLRSQATALQSEKADLQNQLHQTKAPKIITRLGTTDVRSSPARGHPWSGQIRLYVAGDVWNVGTAAAQNFRLHVTLYQGEVVANETYIELGTIAAGTWKDVASDIYYEGSALTNWTIILQFSW